MRCRNSDSSDTGIKEIPSGEKIQYNTQKLNLKNLIDRKYSRSDWGHFSRSNTIDSNWFRCSAMY